MDNETSIEVFAKSGHWKHKITNAVDSIPESDLSKEKIESVLAELQVEAEVIVHDLSEIEHTQYQINQQYDKCPKCKKGFMVFSKFCGVEVCSICNNHKSLSKCYCGWNVRDDVDKIESGMTEHGKFDGDTWEGDY